MAGQKSAFDKMPSSVSPLERAFRLQEEAAELSLEWLDGGNVWSRINEELAEAKAADEDPAILASRLAARLRSDTDSESDPTRSFLTEELGNLLFAVVDVCRALHVDPEEALNEVNLDFAGCLAYVVDRSCEEGVLPGMESPERIRELWFEANRRRREKDPIPFRSSAGAGCADEATVARA